RHTLVVELGPVSADWRIQLTRSPSAPRGSVVAEPDSVTSLLWVSAFRHVGEAGEVPLEGDRNGARGPVAVLGDDEVGLGGAGVVFLVHALAVPVQKDDDVGVLLQRPRLAQV